MFEILTRAKFDTNILLMRSFLGMTFIIIYNPLLSQDKTFKTFMYNKGPYELHKKKMYNLFSCPYNNYIAKISSQNHLARSSWKAISTFITFSDSTLNNCNVQGISYM